MPTPDDLPMSKMSRLHGLRPCGVRRKMKMEKKHGSKEEMLSHAPTRPRIQLLFSSNA